VNPEHNAEFNKVSSFQYSYLKNIFYLFYSKAMTTLDSIIPFKGTFTKNYDFSKAKHVVDVGGGHGNLIVEVLLANPHLTGTSYDQVFHSPRSPFSSTHVTS
jgi:hypothetical protein